MMSTPAWAATWLLLASTACHADNNCEAIRNQIDAKIRASGVSQFTLTTVDAAASAAGRNVGSCDRGAKKILYAASTAAGSGAVRPKSEAILTECKDGTVSMGGSCRK